jgi:hypothetical protein
MNQLYMLNRYFKIAGAVMLSVFMITSCRIEPNEDCEYGYKKGVVIYAGAPETDGCGWLIVIDSISYHPVNLSVDYQVSDLSILIKYEFEAVTDEFRCGRGGMTYPSIRIKEIKIEAEDVGILKDDQWDKYSMDAFQLDSAYIDNDLLMMKVSYGGGCKVHEFHLWKLPPNALNPPPVELALSHDNNNDMCDAWVTRWLTYSLIPLRERGKHEITFLLRGSPEMSAYFGEFTYKY